MLRSWHLNLSITPASGVSVYLQIAQQITDEIQRGRLTPSTAMPSTRELAAQLNVNRKTIVLAYDELIAQGWLSAENRRGTFVSADLPRFLTAPAHQKTAPDAHTATTPNNAVLAATDDYLATQTPIDFNDGIPDTRLIPFEILARAFRHALLSPAKNNRLGYGDPKGTSALRQSIVTMLNLERGLNINTEQVCITRGSQMGIFLAASVIIKPDDYVVVEKLSYPPAREAFKSCGAKILTVGLDKHGMDVKALEALCKTHAIRAIYVTPHHQFPTTVMMTAERRLKLLMLAAQYHFHIIEDDYDHEFHFAHHPVFPLASTNHHHRVIYVGSLSKVLAPGLRVGYLVASQALINACANQVMIIDRQGNSITELAVAELMASGEIKRHIHRTFKIYEARRNALIQMIDTHLSQFVQFDAPSGGLAIWLRLNPQINIRALVHATQQEQVRILPGSAFSADAEDIPAIRLGFGSLNANELEDGILRLKKAFQRLSRTDI